MGTVFVVIHRSNVLLYDLGNLVDPFFHVCAIQVQLPALIISTPCMIKQNMLADYDCIDGTNNSLYVSKN